MLVIALLINCQVEQVSKRGLSSLLSSYTYALFFFLTTAGYQNIYERSSDIFFKFLISYFFFLECGAGRGGCVNHHSCLRI